MPVFGLTKLKQKKSSLIRKKKYPRGFTLKQSLKASLGQGVDLRKAVALPPNEDLNEWLAMLTMENFNSTVLCWDLVSEFCSETSCPTMSAGPAFTYLWQDSNTEAYAKSTPVPACQYVKLLVEWINKCLDNESYFPTTTHGHFPKKFEEIVAKIWRRLFRVYFHIYHHHQPQIVKLKAEGHINTSFKALYYASMEFNLLKEKDFLPVKSILHNVQGLQVEDPKGEKEAK